MPSWIRTSSSAAHRAGFTLIELVAVMVVVGVLAATAVPTLSKLTATRASTAGRLIHRNMLYARQRAVATGVGTWVVFDVTLDTWSVYSEDPSNPGRANASVLMDPANGRSFTTTLDQGDFAAVSLVSAMFDGNAEVGFDWLGRPLNAAETSLSSDGTVTLNSGASIVVTAATGHTTYVSP